MNRPTRSLRPSSFRVLLLSLALLISAPGLSRAQFFGPGMGWGHPGMGWGGAYGWGHPGMGWGGGYGWGGGVGWGGGLGFGYPGYGAGFGFNPNLTPFGSIAPGALWPSYGYPTALATTNPMLLGASYTSIASGYGPPLDGFGLGYYNPYFSAGLTPLAVQSAVSEMTLRSAARPAMVLPEVRIEIPVGPSRLVEPDPEPEPADPGQEPLENEEP
ncbi:hypothetical protein BH23PLA1_BH23PLA1_40340 [soil metagenome]